MHQTADVMDISYKMQLLLEIQKEETKPANTDNQAISSKKRESVTEISHRITPPRLHHCLHQHFCPDIAQDLLQSSLFTSWLHPTKDRTFL